MWATDLRFMNDASEVKIGLDAVLKVLKPQIEALELRVRHQVSRAAFGASFDFPSRIYAISFSSDGDDLSQWRAYCPNGGYAIRFPFYTQNVLVDIAALNGWELGKVEYDAQQHVRLAEEFAAEVLERFAPLRDPHPELVPELRNLRHGIDSLAAMMKDTAFAAEQEWRLMSAVLPQNRPQFRTTRFGLTPYREVDLDGDRGLSRTLGIVVGPSPNQDLARAAALELLLDNPYQAASRSQMLSWSRIPWRVGGAT